MAVINPDGTIEGEMHVIEENVEKPNTGLTIASAMAALTALMFLGVLKLKK